MAGGQKKTVTGFKKISGFEEALFNLFWVSTKGNDCFSTLVQWSYLWQFLQYLAPAFAETVPWTWNSDKLLSSIISTCWKGVTLQIVSTSELALWISFSVVTLLVVITLVDAAVVVFLFKHERVFLFPIRLLRTLSVSISTFLFMPCLGILLSVTSPRVVLTGRWQFPGLVGSVISVVVAAVFLPACAFASVFMFAPRPKAKQALGRPNAHFDLLMLFCKLISVALSKYWDADTPTVPLVLQSLLILFVVAACIWMQPYFRRATNVLVMLPLLPPLAIALAGVAATASYLRGRWLWLYKPGQPLTLLGRRAPTDQDDGSLTPTPEPVGLHPAASRDVGPVGRPGGISDPVAAADAIEAVPLTRAERQLGLRFERRIRKFRSAIDVDRATRFLQLKQYRTKQHIAYADRIYQLALQNKHLRYDAGLYVRYGLFQLAFMKDPTRAGILVTKAAALSPSFEYRFLIYGNLKDSEANAVAAKDTVMTMLATKKNTAEAERYHRKVRQHMRDAWGMLLMPHVDVKVLQHELTESMTAADKAEAAYVQLLEQNPNSIAALRLTRPACPRVRQRVWALQQEFYGNEQLAETLFLRADVLEEERSKRHAQDGSDVASVTDGETKSRASTRRSSASRAEYTQKKPQVHVCLQPCPQMTQLMVLALAITLAVMLATRQLVYGLATEAVRMEAIAEVASQAARVAALLHMVPLYIHQQAGALGTAPAPQRHGRPLRRPDDRHETWLPPLEMLLAGIDEVVDQLRGVYRNTVDPRDSFWQVTIDVVNPQVVDGVLTRQTESALILYDLITVLLDKAASVRAAVAEGLYWRDVDMKNLLFLLANVPTTLFQELALVSQRFLQQSTAAKGTQNAVPLIGLGVVGAVFLLALARLLLIVRALKRSRVHALKQFLHMPKEVVDQLHKRLKASMATEEDNDTVLDERSSRSLVAARNLSNVSLPLSTVSATSATAAPGGSGGEEESPRLLHRRAAAAAPSVSRSSSVNSMAVGSMAAIPSTSALPALDSAAILPPLDPQPRRRRNSFSLLGDPDGRGGRLTLLARAGDGSGAESESELAGPPEPHHRMCVSEEHLPRLQQPQSSVLLPAMEGSPSASPLLLSPPAIDETGSSRGSPLGGDLSIAREFSLAGDDPAAHSSSQQALLLSQPPLSSAGSAASLTVPPREGPEDPGSALSALSQLLPPPESVPLHSLAALRPPDVGLPARGAEALGDGTHPPQAPQPEAELPADEAHDEGHDDAHDEAARAVEELAAAEVNRQMKRISVIPPGTLRQLVVAAVLFAGVVLAALGLTYYLLTADRSYKHDIAASALRGAVVHQMHFLAVQLFHNASGCALAASITNRPPLAPEPDFCSVGLLASRRATSRAGLSVYADVLTQLHCLIRYGQAGCGSFVSGASDLLGILDPPGNVDPTSARAHIIYDQTTCRMVNETLCRLLPDRLALPAPTFTLNGLLFSYVELARGMVAAQDAELPASLTSLDRLTRAMLFDLDGGCRMANTAGAQNAVNTLTANGDTLGYLMIGLLCLLPLLFADRLESDRTERLLGLVPDESKYSMLLDWQKTAVVGVRGIDDQHKRLFEYAHQLAHAVINAQDRTTQQRVMELLSHFIAHHSSFELRLARRHRYPEDILRRHEDAHRRLLDMVKQAQRDLQKGGDLFEFIRTFGKVLPAHIRQHDLPLGRWITTKGTAVKGLPVWAPPQAHRFLFSVCSVRSAGAWPGLAWLSLLRVA
ncbi:hypothetical protein PAPYR_4458 [Paratrimastix pyriformis]|uniref:TmcB/TmcC TPR repeats domain-containing protein n=1 Tax=Paratrimastix pyriformis TaxID=342808 RepID=A0ABQ8UMK9_9EUKA|nr:hypothetical protein PAPYR_4458 [Paratrimastix pyriformis]